jgi:hypothetical protein
LSPPSSNNDTPSARHPRLEHLMTLPPPLYSFAAFIVSHHQAGVAELVAGSGPDRAAEWYRKTVEMARRS